jgi:hypothetical protein
MKLTYKSLLGNLSKFYDIYKSPKYIIGDWVIVNNEIYEKYKSKIKILHASIYDSNTKTLDISNNLVDHKQITIICESKKEYITLKYNSNFLALSFAITEYGININELTLLAVRKMEKDKDIPENIPHYTTIFKLLNWKLTKKAKENIEFFL